MSKDVCGVDHLNAGAGADISSFAGKTKPEAGPTAENAMAAEEALARAFRNNDADALSC
jgi:hypothetical protein